MSEIVGLDGKPISEPDEKPKEQEVKKKHTYKAGGLKMESTLTPDVVLQDALSRIQKMVGEQTYMATLKKYKDAIMANAHAQAAVSRENDPFGMEPCAMAVFMYLCREIDHRDRIIEQIQDRLTSLGAEPLNTSHLYAESDSEKDGGK
jgi:hypothetical protein